MAKAKKFRVKGIKQAQGANFDYFKRAQRGAVKGIRVWGEETMTITKAQHTPFDTGNLRGSGMVDPEGSSSLQPTVELSFGGESPADEYAVVVHENTKLKHKHGSSKYLEIGSLNESGRLAPIVAEFVNRETGRGRPA